MKPPIAVFPLWLLLKCKELNEVPPFRESTVWQTPIACSWCKNVVASGDADYPFSCKELFNAIISPMLSGVRCPHHISGICDGREHVKEEETPEA